MGGWISASLLKVSRTSSTSTPTAISTRTRASRNPPPAPGSATPTSPSASWRPPSNEAMDIRPIEPQDTTALAEILRRIETFTPAEVSCALELIELALTPGNPDYAVLVAIRGGVPVGYVCFGPTPMTDGT